MAQELRYGRVEETFGEDGYLAGEIGYAYIKGLQGGNVSATVKRFAASASPEQGHNLGPVHGGERGFGPIIHLNSRGKLWTRGKFFRAGPTSAMFS